MSTININKAIQRILLFLRGGSRALETEETKEREGLWAGCEGREPDLSSFTVGKRFLLANRLWRTLSTMLEEFSDIYRIVNGL